MLTNAPLWPFLGYSDGAAIGSVGGITHSPVLIDGEVIILLHAGGGGGTLSAINENVKLNIRHYALAFGYICLIGLIHCEK